MMKGTKCLRIFVLLVFAASLMVLLVPAISMASFSSGDNYDQGPLNPVRFFVVDSSEDSSVILSASTYDFSGEGYVLQYKDQIKSPSWANFGGPITINMGPLVSDLVYLRLDGTPDDVTSGDITFQSFQKHNDGFDLFTAVNVDWTDVSVLTINTTTNDSVAPVPIPATMLLFGSALLCLLGFRTRKE